jgi:hypothetical protein
MNESLERIQASALAALAGARTSANIRTSKDESPLFLAICKEVGLHAPALEWEFALPERAFRFDYAWPECRVALEVEGGIFSGGRHTNAVGFATDVDKYNRAAAGGWFVVRCIPGARSKTIWNRNKRKERTSIAASVPALLDFATARLVKSVIDARRVPPPTHAHDAATRAQEIIRALSVTPSPTSLAALVTHLTERF